MPEPLDGKTAIVTAAGEGIGLAIAKRMLEAGANVMLADSDEKVLGKAYDSLEDEANAARFHFEQPDKLCIANLLAATIDRFEHVDILVNGPQAADALAHFLDLGVDDFDTALREHVRGVFGLSQYFARKLVQQGEAEGAPNGGAIVNITSIAAQRTVPDLLAYSVPCAALDQLTRSMAAGLAPHGIRVNAVAIGAIMTGRLRAMLRENEELREALVRTTPLGRIAEVEEAAEVALFLATEQASYVTGQILPVDGGRTILDPLAAPVR